MRDLDLASVGLHIVELIDELEPKRIARLGLPRKLAHHVLGFGIVPRNCPNACLPFAGLADLDVTCDRDLLELAGRLRNLLMGRRGGTGA